MRWKLEHDSHSETWIATAALPPRNDVIARNARMREAMRKMTYSVVPLCDPSRLSRLIAFFLG
jgi:hypothetical protein